jgi:hypothetical protein
MSKKNNHKKILTISGKRAQKALEVGLDSYLQSVGYTGTFLQHAGSIEFSDDEFAAMLQALKEDK